MRRVNFKIREEDYILLADLLKEKGGTLSSVMRGLIKDNVDYKSILKKLDALEETIKNDKTRAMIVKSFLDSAYCRIALEALINTTNMGAAVNKNFEEFKRSIQKEGGR